MRFRLSVSGLEQCNYRAEPGEVVQGLAAQFCTNMRQQEFGLRHFDAERSN
jgi:hypothetical protein